LRTKTDNSSGKSINYSSHLWIRWGMYTSASKRDGKRVVAYTTYDAYMTSRSHVVQYRGRAGLFTTRKMLISDAT
jgi:hypothetical protein